MNLSQALLEFIDKGDLNNKEKAFKVIANYIANEEANWYQMNDIEHDQLKAECRDELELMHSRVRSFKRNIEKKKEHRLAMEQLKNN